MEQTLVLIKPDAVERNIIGEIINIYEKNNLKVIALNMIKASEEIAKKHYEEHKEKNFFNELISYITRSPVCALILQGDNAVEEVRLINGSTDPSKADKETIRGKFGVSKEENTVHSSDSLASADREIKIWF